MKIMITLLLIFNVTLGIFVGFSYFKRGELKENILGQINRNAFDYQNGIFTYSYNIGFARATTTACSIPALEATSTVIHASLKLRNGTSTDNLIQIGKSAGPADIETVYASGQFASTSNPNVVYKETGELVASSSLQEKDNWILPPNNYVNFIFGTSTGWNKSDGNCQLKLQIL